MGKIGFGNLWFGDMKTKEREMLVRVLLKRIAKYSLVLSSDIFPLYKKNVLFCSFSGMYNDNPKPVSEMLHEKAPDIPIYWAVSEKCKEKLPDYVHKVYFDTLRYWALHIPEWLLIVSLEREIIMSRRAQ